MRLLAVTLAIVSVALAASAQQPVARLDFPVASPPLQLSAPQVDFGAGMKPKDRSQISLSPFANPFPFPLQPLEPTEPPGDCGIARRADSSVDPKIAKAPPPDVNFTMRVFKVPPCFGK